DGYITASYNALNQPKAIWTASYGSNYLWYGYDPWGRCVKQWVGPGDGSAPGFIRYSYYDGWNLIEDGSSPWNPEHFYVHGARVDEIVASYTWGEPSYHHYDANGNCMTLTNAAGNITEQYYYDAFGKPYLFDGAGNWLASSPSGNRFLFTGREYLSDLKVYDYRNRLYNPQMGRFLQPDPKEFGAGDYNLYRYCHNDPVNRSDPTGLVDETWTRQMYLQSGEKDSFEVVLLNKSLNEKGYVSAAQLQMVDENKSKSTPGKPSRNLGGSELDEFGNKMAAKGYSTGPEGREQISYLFEKDGAAARYIASQRIAEAE